MEQESSEFGESDKSMNWAQFKDPVSHMCLADTVAASWSLTQEVAGSNPFTGVTNDNMKTFRVNSNTLN